MFGLVSFLFVSQLTSLSVREATIGVYRPAVAIVLLPVCRFAPFCLCAAVLIIARGRQAAVCFHMHIISQPAGLLMSAELSFVPRPVAALRSRAPPNHYYTSGKMLPAGA